MGSYQSVQAGRSQQQQGSSSSSLGAVEGPGSDLICQFDNFIDLLILQGLAGLQFHSQDTDRGLAFLCFC